MSEIERYLDELFGRLAGTGAAGRRVLAEAEDHLRAAAADAMTCGLQAEQAEHEAVTRFGSSGAVARKMRAAYGGGRVSRAVSVGWLMAGLAAAALGGTYLAEAGQLGWQSTAGACTTFLSPVCYSIGGPVMRDIQSAVIAAGAGAMLLLGRWLAVRYTGLAPSRRGIALAAGLLLGLVAFCFGMAGLTPALHAEVFSGLLSQPIGRVSFIGVTAVMECLAAAVSLADSPRRCSRPTT
jgi:hypothetical protein